MEVTVFCSISSVVVSDRVVVAASVVMMVL